MKQLIYSSRDVKVEGLVYTNESRKTMLSSRMQRSNPTRSITRVKVLISKNKQS